MTEKQLLAVGVDEPGGTTGRRAGPATGGISVPPRVIPGGLRVATSLGRYGALIALAAMLVGFSLTSRYFFTSRNLLDMLDQAALPIIIAVGLTFVLAGNEFDLSIGYMASLAGMFFTLLLLHGVPIPLAFIATLGVGGVGGMFNGFLVVRLEVNALVATLGSGFCFLGVNYLLTSGTPITILSPSFLGIAIGDWFGIPRPVVYMVVVSAVLWVVLTQTSFGRHVRAVGANIDAARLAGIRVGLVRFVSFMLCGAMAALVGLLLASELGSGQPDAADQMTLGAFAAGFLGSTVMSEGRFHIVGTVVGGVVVGTGLNGLALFGLPTDVQYFFQGGVLIIAVAVSSFGRRVARR